MLNRRLMMTSALVAASIALPGTVRADEPIKVVATFSILGDMVGVVGGDKIELTTLVGPDGDAHVYQPTPKAAKAVSEADLLIINGLEFEGWLERLTEAASFDGDLIVATNGIEAIAYGEDDDHHDEHKDHDGHEDHASHKDHDHDKHDDHDHEKHADHDEHEDEHHDEEHAKHDDHDDDDDHAGHDDHDHKKEHAGHDDHEEHAGHDGHDGHDHGAYDPHAWQSLRNVEVYVDNITQGLAKADPANAGVFFTNRAAYVTELESLDAEITALMAALPEDKRTVVTSHDAFQYFGQDYGLTFKAPQGLSTESEASAKDVAELIEQMRDENISAVFIENITDSRLLEQIASETGAVIGGTLYPGALSSGDGPAATFLDMMRHNATTLAGALGS